MRWLDRLRVLFTGRLPEEAKQAAGATAIHPGVAQWPEPGYVNWAKEAYGKNELVYACIQELATSVPEAPLKVYRETDAGWEEVPDHPLRQLIRRPNPIMSEYELWELTIVHLYLAGNAFWEVVRSRSGRPVELWPLRPDRVRIIPSEDPRVHHTYAYALEGRLWDLGTDVVHFKLPNPVDPYFGQPPLRAAVRAVAVDNEATEYVKSLLQNDATPLAVIKTTQAVDDATYRRLKERWEERHGGRNRGRMGVLSPGMEVQVLGLNLRDLEFPDLRTISETRICMVFGVPPILVGAKTGVDRSTYANYAEARRSFWEETVSPLLRRLEDRINHTLLPMFGREAEGVEAWFDTSEVSALQESVNELWDRVTRAVEAGWLLIDEGRAEAGYEALPGGQGRVRLVRSNVMEVPVGPPEEEPNDEGNAGSPARPAVAPQAGPASGGVGEGAEEPASSPAEAGGGSEPEARQRGPTLHKAREDIARDRQRLADRWEDRWREWAQEEFRQEARDTLRAFSFLRKALGRKSLEDDELIEVLTRLIEMSIRWRGRIRETVMELAIQQIIEAAEAAGSEVGAAFELDNELAQRFVERYVFAFAERLAETSREQIRSIILAGQRDGLTIDEMTARLREAFADWTEARARMVARTETIRASNAGALLGYQEAGVKLVEWLPASDACPYCAALRGKRWAIGAELFRLGDLWHPEGVERPYRIDYEPVRHPPLHPECRCTLVPVVD